MTRESDSPGVRVRFGPFEADLRAHELRKFGIRVKLQDQPFRVLIALLERPGEVMAREDLQRRIWGDETVVDFHHGLGTAVNKLREALGDSPDNPRYVETLARRGYRFIAPVQPLEAAGPLDVTVTIPATPSVLAASVEVAAVSTGRETVVSAAPAPLKTRTWRIAAGVGVLAAAVMVVPFGRGIPPAPLRFSEITWSSHVYQGEDNIERFSGLGTDGLRIYYSESRDGNLVLASSPVGGGDSQIVPIPADIVRPVLADISRDGSKLLVRSLPFSELEGALWVVPSTGGTASRVTGGLGHAAAWMPDGKGIVFALGRDLLVTHNDGQAPQKLVTLGGRPFAIRYAPDGSSLRFTLLDPATHTSSLWELSTDGKKLHRLLPTWQDPPHECCGTWTADGAYYVFQATFNGSSDIWALDERSWPRDAGKHPIQVTAGPLSYKLPVPAVKDDRIFVIGAHTRNQLLRLEMASGRPKSWVADLNARRIALSPDVQFIAWTSANDGLLWRSQRDGSQRLQLISPPIQALRLAWSPDGRMLAFDGGEPGHLSKIYVVPANGGTPEMLLRENRNETDPSWSADGKSIVFGRLPEYLGEDSEEKSIYVVDVQSRKVTQLPGSAGLFSPRWSPDGRRIAAMSLNQRRLMFLELASSRWSSVEVPMIAKSPTWSSDSKFLYFMSGTDSSIYRIAMEGRAERRLERVGGMENIQPADSFVLVGLSAENSPLVLAKSATADIYALDWRRR